MDDRSGWESLTSQVIPLMKQLTESKGPRRKLTLVAESFGGCLAWRLALAVPDLIANMVVLNSATCFDKSYGGIINLIAASKLLSLFPEQLYQVTHHFNDACLQPCKICQDRLHALAKDVHHHHDVYSQLHLSRCTQHSAHACKLQHSLCLIAPHQCTMHNTARPGMAAAACMRQDEQAQCNNLNLPLSHICGECG